MNGSKSVAVRVGRTAEGTYVRIATRSGSPHTDRQTQSVVRLVVGIAVGQVFVFALVLFDVSVCVSAVIAGWGRDRETVRRAVVFTYRARVRVRVHRSRRVPHENKHS